MESGWEVSKVMKITFLGTSSGAPTRARNVSSIALQWSQTGKLWLFDCGEGTQHQVLRSPLRLSQLERVFFTHLHGDHLFGITGLLATRSMMEANTTPVALYGPAGLAEYLQCTLDGSQTRLGYPIQIKAVTGGRVYEDESVRVECAPLIHRAPTFGYAIVEKEQTGRFDVEMAQALGVPAGPLYGRLKQGESVTLPDGRTIHGADLVGPPRPGRKLVYCGDTTYTPNAVALARDADVLIHEATYLEEDRPLAVRAQHSTALSAARVAREASVQLLLLTHISPRYEAGGRLNDLLAEARSVFPNTLLADDFFTYEIPRKS